MARISKFDLIPEVALRASVTENEALKVMDAFIHRLYELLRQGDTVNLAGFGQFSVSHREARLGVNPQKPEQKIMIQDLITPKFKAGVQFKRAIRP